MSLHYQMKNKGKDTTCKEIYQGQKQDGRADLMVQPVILHGQVARKQLG